MNESHRFLVSVGLDWARLPLIVGGLAVLALGAALIKRAGPSRGRQVIGWIVVLAGAVIANLVIR